VGNASEPIQIGDSGPEPFTFQYRAAVSLQIVFYEDAAGTVPIPPSAGGSATLSITRQCSAYTGSSVNPTRVNLPVSAIDGGVEAAVPGATLKGFALGGGAESIFAQATAVVAPGAPVGVSYRLHVDASPRS